MDPEMVRELAELVGSVGAPAAAVIFAMKYAISGMRADVREIKEDVKVIKLEQQHHATRLAIIEDRNTRVDAT